MAGRKGHKATEYKTNVDKLACRCFNIMKDKTKDRWAVIFGTEVGGRDHQLQADVRAATILKLKEANLL